MRLRTGAGTESVVNLRLFVILVAAATLVLLTGGRAHAWTPYAHVFASDNAYADAVDNGRVTIGDDEYPLNPRLVLALQQKPATYNAGVVGPDGFPDSVFGQAVLHPKDSGAWLQHTLNSAWAAQTDPGYTEDQKLEILAFSYGFLTHAAGDMWAHTLVNDFTGGLADIFGGPAAAGFTVKHLILEGYIGDATPGFDGNPNRNLAPGVNEDGDPDVSDDSTDGIAFAPPPDRFLYEVYIARGADADGHLVNALPGQPTADRGAIVDFFYTLRNKLYDEAGTNSNVQDAIDAYNALEAGVEDAISDCTALLPPRPIACAEALVALGGISLEVLLTGAESLLAAAAEDIVDAYFAAWVEDIDYGLQHYSGVGMAFTTGLFDPQTRRNAQNLDCDEEGSEADLVRADCEDSFGRIDSLFAALDPTLTTTPPHLLSMVGFPDFTLTLMAALEEISAFIDGLVDFPNYIDEGLEELRTFVKNKINEALKEELEFDPLVFAELLKNPSSYLDPVHPPLSLPPPLDALDDAGGLFAAGEHERLDRIMGMDGAGLVDEHHDLTTRRLDDDAEFVTSEFAPMANTITTAKLLLLDGTGLNQVLSDQLGRTIWTYPADGNVLVTALASSDPWLQSIDSDHAWRRDGLPGFCNPGGPCVAASIDRRASIVRAAEFNGGNGTMPIWESCVLRPAFRTLYRDWENGAEQFPELSDVVSADPANDPAAPESRLTPSGAIYDNGVRKFIGGNNAFTLTAHDEPPTLAFADNQLQLQYRVYTNPLNRGAWLNIAQGGTFSISGPDGQYFVDVRSGDPCHTIDDTDALPAEAPQTFVYFLDTTPPRVTCDTPPFGLSFDTDDFSNVDYEVDDGADGSGVASFSSTIDGFLVLPGVVSIADGAAIDMYQYYPSTRTVAVTAADNIGNSGTSPCTFEIHATTESLLSNLARARADGKIMGPSGTYNSLRAKLQNADKKHEKGAHATEHNMLGAFIHELSAQRGKHVDATTADRFIAFARDLIATGG